MHKLKAMKSVYCYYFPEVREVLKQVDEKLPDDIFLVTTPAEIIEDTLEGFFSKRLDVPSTKYGYIDLDRIHEPIIERILDIYSPLTQGLKSSSFSRDGSSEFAFRYPTSGSSEGIFHLLVNLKTKGINEINVLSGEYEGYGIQANNIGIRVNTYDKTVDPRKITPGTWFISNPSAINGNIIPEDFFKELYNNGHHVVLDLAYLGSTKKYCVDLESPYVNSVLMSFSKPYGVFRHRIGGFTFSKEPINTLYGNKWFKDVKRLFQALKLAEDIGPGGLYEKYRPIQSSIIENINKDLYLGIKKSDVLLLGYMTKKDASKLDEYSKDTIEEFRRGEGYRFCLTPYFEERERNIK